MKSIKPIKCDDILLCGECAEKIKKHMKVCMYCDTPIKWSKK